jgi:hypothetical protein
MNKEKQELKGKIENSSTKCLYIFREDLQRLVKCLESKKKLESELKILETQLKS